MHIFMIPFLEWRASLAAQMLKNLPAMLETQVWSLGWEDPLEKRMAAHSSILAWRIPWTEEPGGLQSMGLQRVRHNSLTELLGNEARYIWICCCSVAQSGPTLCDPMDCSTLGFPVLHHLPELAQTHVHWVSDAIQPSHPLSSPSPALILSHLLMKRRFASSDQSTGASVWALVLPMNIQDWFLLGLTGLINFQSKGLSIVFSHIYE